MCWTDKSKIKQDGFSGGCCDVLNPMLKGAPRTAHVPSRREVIMWNKPRLSSFFLLTSKTRHIKIKIKKTLWIESRLFFRDTKNTHWGSGCLECVSSGLHSFIPSLWREEEERRTLLNNYCCLLWSDMWM